MLRAAVNAVRKPRQQCVQLQVVVVGGHAARCTAARRRGCCGAINEEPWRYSVHRRLLSQRAMNGATNARRLIRSAGDFNATPPHCALRRSGVMEQQCRSTQTSTACSGARKAPTSAAVFRNRRPSVPHPAIFRAVRFNIRSSRLMSSDERDDDKAGAHRAMFAMARQARATRAQCVIREEFTGVKERYRCGVV